MRSCDLKHKSHISPSNYNPAQLVCPDKGVPTPPPPTTRQGALRPSLARSLPGVAVRAAASQPGMAGAGTGGAFMKSKNMSECQREHESCISERRLPVCVCVCLSVCVQPIVIHLIIWPGNKPPGETPKVVSLARLSVTCNVCLCECVCVCVRVEWRRRGGWGSSKRIIYIYI